MPESDFLSDLLDASDLLSSDKSLEQALGELAAATVELTRAGRCSIMLVDDRDDDGEHSRLRIFAHSGAMSLAARGEHGRLSKGIADVVLESGRALLIADIHRSQFAPLARFAGSENPSLVSAPIQARSKIIGVINLSGQEGGRILSEKDLRLISIFAKFVGQSISVYQLQKIAESRILQLAILREQAAQGGIDGAKIAPDPVQIAPIVAKSLYRELVAAGFGPNAVIRVAGEVLSELKRDVSDGGGSASQS